ncbi:hypothetical protein VTN00DRAFT_8235 [Thermoascus crustaceus]|uniref:uncharacterized protein n=1 Tax=Thermoascus crustaceus TaxID=5088 RepID=UPI0037443629
MFTLKKKSSRSEKPSTDLLRGRISPHQGSTSIGYPDLRPDEAQAKSNAPLARWSRASNLATGQDVGVGIIGRRDEVIQLSRGQASGPDQRMRLCAMTALDGDRRVDTRQASKMVPKHERLLPPGGVVRGGGQGPIADGRAGLRDYWHIGLRLRAKHRELCGLPDVAFSSAAGSAALCVCFVPRRPARSLRSMIF